MEAPLLDNLAGELFGMCVCTMAGAVRVPLVVAVVDSTRSRVYYNGVLYTQKPAQEKIAKQTARAMRVNQNSRFFPRPLPRGAYFDCACPLLSWRCRRAVLFALQEPPRGRR